MDPQTQRSRILSLVSRTVAVMVALLLVPVVLVARERNVTGGFIDAPAVSVSGVARVIVPTEPPADPQVDPTRWVIQRGNTVIPIEDKDAEALVPGQIVRATVSASDGVKAVVRTYGVTKPYAPIALRNLLVVPVQWAGRPMTDARLSAAANTSTDLAAWWSAASGGIETLTVRTAPVLAVNPTKECDDFGVADQVRAWVASSDNASWVTNTAMLWPENSGCWYGGLGSMPGNFTWMNSTSAPVWAHELGHNMGLPHANSCSMRDTANPQLTKSALPSYLSTCMNNEYGNLFDIMGSSGNLASGYNAQYLNNIGWLREGQVSTWAGIDRTYRLSLLSSASGATRAVRIPATKALGSFDEGDFWLQYRAKDSSFYVANVPGVVLTMDPSVDYLDGMGFDEEGSTGGSWLCPINNAAAESAPKFTLTAGSPFDDRLGRFRISLVSITPDVAEVRVQPGVSRQVVNATNVVTSLQVDDAGTPTGGLTVTWNASTSPDPNLAEPSIWTATVSPGGASCSVPVFLRSCTIRRLPRGQTLAVTVTGTTPVGTGTATGPPVGAVPVTSPFVVVDSTAGETSVQVRPRVEDDGGAPVTAITVTSAGGATCVATAAECSFSGLAANHEHAFTVESTNAAGKRSANVKVTTLIRRPSAPVGSISVSGNTETITVDADPLDRYNASNIYASCWGLNPKGTDFWNSESTFGYKGEPIVYTHDTAEGKTRECRVFAYNLRKGYSPVRVLQPGSNGTGSNSTGGSDPTGGSTDEDGTVTTVPVDNPITISVKATRFQRGRYVVRWMVRSRDGKSVRVTVPKFGSRKCVPRTRTSCVVVGLRPGKTYKVVFVGKTSVATKKVNFSIRAR